MKREAKTETVELKNIEVKTATITIEGTSDLVLNKMNARTQRELTVIRTNDKSVKQVPNVWEDIITAVHWRDELPTNDTYADCSEEMYHKLLAENAPCISAFGLKKSFGDAVVRNEIDKYKTKLDNAVNIGEGFIPVTFTKAWVDERLMSPKRGAPVLVRINHFCNWTAKFTINFTENVYSLNELVDIINRAGFGLGIGSGRSSGYGRYKVVNVE